MVWVAGEGRSDHDLNTSGWQYVRILTRILKLVDIIQRQILRLAEIKEEKTVVSYDPDPSLVKTKTQKV